MYAAALTRPQQFLHVVMTCSQSVSCLDCVINLPAKKLSTRLMQLQAASAASLSA